ncbi:MAG: hypothetical protein ACUBOA_00360 [Candidatus Loosdrechtia sp.]|uniref:hypothetical protein n=1 Tax=Candidatus Loosdrechtia sp. TaxID=3101272 RepID=UPI003A66E5BA|nr:MAG: hypothetical protein QY305_13415 [Candidatus Jettenia sp. AMX2]
MLTNVLNGPVAVQVSTHIVRAFVSSPDYQFIVNLYNGLLNMKEFGFGNDITLKLEKVFMLNEKKINEKNR